MSKAVNRLSVQNTCRHLRDLRKQNHLRVGDIARKAGVSANAVYRWEEDTLPPLEALYILSQLYGVAMQDLVVGETEQVRDA